jgi:hypothetical protein
MDKGLQCRHSRNSQVDRVVNCRPSESHCGGLQTVTLALRRQKVPLTCTDAHRWCIDWGMTKSLPAGGREAESRCALLINAARHLSTPVRAVD